MPIIRSAKKALRQSVRRRALNIKRKSAMKDLEKKIASLIKAGDKGGAKKLLPQAYKAIDKAKKRGVIKANTASRKKSRLARLLSK